MHSELKKQFKIAKNKNKYRQICISQWYVKMIRTAKIKKRRNYLVNELIHYDFLDLTFFGRVLHKALSCGACRIWPLMNKFNISIL